MKTCQGPPRSKVSVELCQNGSVSSTARIPKCSVLQQDSVIPTETLLTDLAHHWFHHFVRYWQCQDSTYDSSQHCFQHLHRQVPLHWCLTNIIFSSLCVNSTECVFAYTNYAKGSNSHMDFALFNILLFFLK